jgi:hypothetical protein
VLVPLAEIAAGRAFPGRTGKTVGDVLAEVSRGGREAASIRATRKAFFPADGEA